MKLSRERAETVRDYLISKGIAADRLTAKGYGESQPLQTMPHPKGASRTVVSNWLNNAD